MLHNHDHTGLSSGWDTSQKQLYSKWICQKHVHAVEKDKTMQACRTKTGRINIKFQSSAIKLI